MRTFRRGRSTFKCGQCGRNTRETGAQSLGSDLCPQCWDLAGLENEVSDGHRTRADVAPEVAELVAEIEKRGGDVTIWHDTFPTQEAK